MNSLIEKIIRPFKHCSISVRVYVFRSSVTGGAIAKTFFNAAVQRANKTLEKSELAVSYLGRKNETERGRDEMPNYIWVK